MQVVMLTMPIEHNHIIYPKTVDAIKQDDGREEDVGVSLPTGDMVWAVVQCSAKLNVKLPF
jgi:hypothetical protein